MTISYKELVSKFVHGKVTNKDIIRAVDYNRCLGNIDIAIDCMELARADEREKITEETVKEYFAGLSGKETALIVLNYLLRGGVTDDDLRGLRLQWIKEQPHGIDVWISWDEVIDGEGGIWDVEPRMDKEYGVYCGNRADPLQYVDGNFCELIGINRGECAKFKIVRVE